MNRPREIGLPPMLTGMVPGIRGFQMGDCGVLVSRDEVPGIVTTRRWHMSISCPNRYPTWDEIGAARDALLPPELCFCIPFPPRAWWLSIHPNCFHLWEIADGPLVECWRLDGEQAKRIGRGTPQPERRAEVVHG